MHVHVECMDNCQQRHRVEKYDITKDWICEIMRRTEIFTWILKSMLKLNLEGFVWSHLSIMLLISHCRFALTSWILASRQFIFFLIVLPNRIIILQVSFCDVITSPLHINCLKKSWKPRLRCKFRNFQYFTASLFYLLSPGGWWPAIGFYIWCSYKQNTTSTKSSHSTSKKTCCCMYLKLRFKHFSNIICKTGCLEMKIIVMNDIHVQIFM